MPSFKKKQFKNTHVQRLSQHRNDHQSRDKKEQASSRHAIYKSVLIHSPSKTPISLEENADKKYSDHVSFCYKTKNSWYRIYDGNKIEKEYLLLFSKTLFNVFLLDDSIFSLFCKTDKKKINQESVRVIEFITSEISKLNVSVDLICFPRRSASANKNNALIRKISNHFKKLYKVTSLDDLFTRLKSLNAPDHNLPVLNVLKQEKLSAKVIERENLNQKYFALKGLLTRELKTRNFLINGQYHCQVKGYKYYEEINHCLDDVNFENILSFDENDNINDSASGLCKNMQISGSNESDAQNSLQLKKNDIESNNTDIEHDNTNINNNTQSDLISILNEYKPIKDLETHKMPSKYDFKENKQKIKKVMKYTTLILTVDDSTSRYYDAYTHQSVPLWGVGVVDGRKCLLNVLYGSSQLQVLDTAVSGKKACFIEYGLQKLKITPFFTKQSKNAVHKYINHHKRGPDSISGNSMACTVHVPYEDVHDKVALYISMPTDCIRITSTNFHHHDRTILKEKKITGKPYKSFDNYVKIKNMFSSKDEVQFYKNVTLYCIDKQMKNKNRAIRHDILDSNLKELAGAPQEKNDRTKKKTNTLPYSRINEGRIVESIGLKGCFKALFTRPVSLGTEVWISVYKQMNVFE